MTEWGSESTEDEEELIGIGLTSGGRLLQCLGAAIREERLVIFSEDLQDGRRRVRQSEERVGPGEGCADKLVWRREES